MGLMVLLSAVAFYSVVALICLSDLYNVYIYDRIFQNTNSLEPGDLEYDYVIVGGGTAGSLIASEMFDKNLLLLEAGAAMSFIPKLPIFGPLYQGFAQDWQYVTEPQEFACKAMNNHQSKWPRGKVFGGTHLLSNLIHKRGEPEEYRCYVDPEEDFNYDADIGRYFEAYEKMMDITEVPYRSKFSRLLEESGREIEFNAFHAPNVNVRHGLRYTTANLYDDRARQQSGHQQHKLLFNAHVNRLLFSDPESGDGKNVRIVGAEFAIGGRNLVAKARKAVIISAGAVGSPAILLRSGIGPKDELKELGIEHLIDLPVGRNLMDHVGTGIDLISLNSSVETGLSDIMSLETLQKFLWNRDGLISMPGCDLAAVTKVLNGSRFNDLQFMVVPVGVNSDSGMHLRRILNIQDKLYYDYFQPCSEEAGREFVTILPVVLKPKSVGVIRLRSKDPLEPPIIDPNYLSHPDDKQVLFEGIQLIKKFVATEILQKMGAQIKKKPFPGCAQHEFDSDEYWMCYIEHITLTSYHPGGTCRMGSDPENSVVDYHFKVHGVENLYVVDASVMPELPAANPIATINMLALRFLDKELT